MAEVDHLDADALASHAEAITAAFRRLQRVDVVLPRPGFVATRMTAGLTKAPFAALADAVAQSVVGALKSRAQTGPRIVAAVLLLAGGLATVVLLAVAVLVELGIAGFVRRIRPPNGGAGIAATGARASPEIDGEEVPVVR